MAERRISKVPAKVYMESPMRKNLLKKKKQSTALKIEKINGIQKIK